MLLFFLILLTTCNFSSVKSKCYDELGCFPHVYPWISLLRPVLPPLHPTKINTTIFVANSESSSPVRIQTWPYIDLEGRFDSYKPTLILTHGFKSHIKIDWCLKLTRAFLSKIEANLFLVDWKNGADYGYLRSVSNIRIVAAEISRLIRYLIDHYSADVSSFHLVGHSLGAHIMSYVGKNITGIARITALDPARPGFQGKHPAVRLHSGDAKFIDVLHTDGRPLLGLGMTVSVGNVDFYFNGGVRQPKCATDGLSDLKSILQVPKMSFNFMYNLAMCSHSRAPLYLAAAVENCKMWAHPYKENTRIIKPEYVPRQLCTFDTCSVVGLDTPKYPTKGDFFVHITPNYPYCSTY